MNLNSLSIWIWESKWPLSYTCSSTHYCVLAGVAVLSEILDQKGLLSNAQVRFSPHHFCLSCARKTWTSVALRRQIKSQEFAQRLGAGATLDPTLILTWPRPSGRPLTRPCNRPCQRPCCPVLTTPCEFFQDVSNRENVRKWCRQYKILWYWNVLTQCTSWRTDRQTDRLKTDRQTELVTVAHKALGVR